jgi:glycosyltransferase involved in cell wall biosynthesis
MQSICERVNTPPKLVQCIQAHNEEEFIGLTLRSIYNEVDRIIVVEGAVKNRPNQTEDGHSTDETVRVIQDFKAHNDPDDKVVFISIPRPWGSLEELKQTFLDVSSPGDWLIINDADEFYRPEDIRRLRRAIDLDPHATEFVPLFLHFYKDWEHIAAPAPDWQPQHQRVFKYQRGMKYNSHPIVTDEDGHCTYFSPHYQHRRVMLNDFYIYHYGYCRRNMKEIMQAKKDYYEKELAQHGGANKEFDAKVDEFLGYKEPDDRLLKFPLDKHPEIVREHPQFGKRDGKLEKKDFGPWTEHELYAKAIAGEPYGNIWLCMTRQSQPHMTEYHNGMEVDSEEVGSASD